jgi:iron complex outermembrane receptor protein
MRTGRVLLLATTILTLPCLSIRSYAQSNNADSNSGELEEIVVTAQKRAENIQDVPIAITALTMQELQSAGVNDTTDIKEAIPNFNFSLNGGMLALPMIRGIGTFAAGPGIENPVALYVDGVYIASQAAGLFNLTDIDQLAVLKGPQGTLFGRNSTGGLIQITTRSPQQDFTSDIHVTGGNLRTYGADAFVAGGLTDKLAASVSLYYYDQSDGFGRNLVNGQDVAYATNSAVRGKLLWTPDDATRVTLALDYLDTNAGQPAASTEPGTLSFIAGQPHLGSPWDINAAFQPLSRLWQDGVSLDIQHDFGTVARLLSITADRWNTFKGTFNGSADALPLLGVFFWEQDQQFSQELQLQSLGEGKLKWVAGVYFFHADGAAPGLLLYGDALGLPPNTDIEDKNNQITQSVAGFAQASYELPMDTQLTAGYRYTTERHSLDASSGLVTPTGATLASQPHEQAQFEHPSWRAALDHQFLPDVMGYLSFNTGSKSGFFDASVTPPSFVKPEYLTAYEAGIKTELFDHRLRFNVAGFYYVDTNVQIFYVNDGVQEIANGSGAKEHGIDADLAWQATRNLTVSASGGWLDARYGAFPNATFSQPQFTPPYGSVFYPGNATGNFVQYAPDYTASLGLTYRLPGSIFPANLGSFSISAHDYENGGWFADTQNRLRQNAYNLFDASALWTARDQHWDIRLWGKNLTNQYYAGQLGANPPFGDYVQPAPGRTYGVTFGAHF